jgi:hypothetical protein
LVPRFRPRICYLRTRCRRDRQAQYAACKLVGSFAKSPWPHVYVYRCVAYERAFEAIILIFENLQRDRSLKYSSLYA